MRSNKSKCSHIAKIISGSVLFLCTLTLHAQLSGYVHDNYSQPVANAKLVFVDELDPSLTYSATSNAAGYYTVSLTSDEALTEKTTLYQASPNPFYYSTELSFSLARACRVVLSVYNVSGQQIRILENASLSADRYVYAWDGFTTNGSKAKPGMYIVVLDAGGEKFTQKVVLVPTHNVASVGTFYEVKSMTVHTYRVTVMADDADTLKLRNVTVPQSNTLDFSLYRRPAVPFAAVGDFLGVWNGLGYDPFFIKGVNLGVSIPGTQPGELAATREQYHRWLTMIGEAGFNAIRIYTLHYPRFYQELALYNNTHPNKPIYLFQGMWLQEDTLNGNLYHYTADFDHGIEEVVDCIHGRRTIGERRGKAFGTFDADVSRWTIAYIIGREIHPYEVEMTDFLNNAMTQYQGTSLRLFNGTPTEVWLAERLDKLVTLEKTRYKSHRPVSVSSWPSLDPMEHPSEPDNLSDEDRFSFNLKRIDMFNASAGYFASYHAYPYYPDFINRDSAYLLEKDEQGLNSYLGYLKHLKRYYSGMPLIISEYGVPSSWGVARQSPSGMNHGGLTETQQGEIDVRLLKSIHTSGCGGGMMFAWIDEWFKSTWLFNSIQSEAERIPLWHSIASPEENFGLISFEPAAPVFKQMPLTGSHSRISSVYAAADPRFFNIRLIANSPLTDKDSIWIGMDTYRESVGESVLPDGSITSKRAEFALLVKADSAKLLVTKDYDLFGIRFNRNNASPEQVYHSTVTDGNPWHLVRLKHNLEDTAVQKIGCLKVRKTGQAETSLDAVWFNGNEINIRIPWHYLNFTDPSARLVMNDDRSTRPRETAESDGIALTLSYKKEKAETTRYLWDIWNQAPPTTERVKPGLSIIKKGNSEVGED